MVVPASLQLGLQARQHLAGEVHHRQGAGLVAGHVRQQRRPEDQRGHEDRPEQRADDERLAAHALEVLLAHHREGLAHAGLLWSDGASAWSTFRYVTLPKLRHALILAVLLRFMDSFKIYAEPFQLTGGGPGNSTTFLSIYTSRKAIGGFNMGYGAAVSIIYFFLVILLSWLLYTIMLNVGGGSSK